MHNSVEKKLSQALLKFGISPSIKGYHYISEAVRLVLNSQEITISFSKRLYPEIAALFNVTAMSVERSIRNAIHTGYVHCDVEFAHSVFQNTLHSYSDIPTNTIFIITLAQWIKYQ